MLHVYEAISGYFVVLARNCLASTLDYIVMQSRKINREKGDFVITLHSCEAMSERNWIMMHANEYWVW